MALHLPPLTFGPGPHDYAHGLDIAELRRQRAERARSVLRENNVAVMLVAGAPSCRYLTGLRGPEVVPDAWYVLFPVESDPVVFHHAGYERTMPREAPWIKEWRTARSVLRGIAGPEACVEEATKFAQAIRSELVRLQLTDEAVAVVGMNAYFNRALTEAGVKVFSGDDLLLQAMSVKTPEELTCLRMAGAITDRMWESMARGCQAGMTDWELSAIGRAAGTSAGADTVNVVFRSGLLAAERGFKGANQFIVPGDLMYGLVCGTSFLGYKTCVYRTFVVGREPSKQELGWMDRLQERLLAVVDQLRPGNTTRDAAEQFPPASTWGFGDEAEILTIEIGHGIGLYAYEQPVINRQWSVQHPQEIKEGMVVAVEGREGIPGEAAVRLEHMAVVTKDGPRLIDRFNPGITQVG
jgi:Xaa-Pro dipeptidase